MKRAGLLLLAAMLAMPAPAEASGRLLKVCADPNNMPFSNAREEGFENRIVRLIAADLHAEVRYTWWAQRRGNVRETLNAGRCDVIPGVVSGLEMLATTRPYYRSTYVAVARPGPFAYLSSLDDPRLATARVGVQLIGDDGANIPPAHALTNRGIVANVHGYPVYGDYDGANPQAAIFDAVRRGEIDIAFAWGPTAGYFARHSGTPLTIHAVTPSIDGPNLPMLFDISMGLRRDDIALRRDLDEALARDAPKIRAILLDYGVPFAD
jgi:mxaJ protein